MRGRTRHDIYLVTETAKSLIVSILRDKAPPFHNEDKVMQLADSGSGTGRFLYTAFADTHRAEAV
jgi:hypothetical protein